MAIIATLNGQVISPPAIYIQPIEYHIIYKITNLRNGKIWFSRRITSDLNDDFLSTDPAFMIEFRRYGRKRIVFKKEILFTYTNAQDADRKEIELTQGRDQSKKLRGIGYFPWVWLRGSKRLVNDSGQPVIEVGL